MNGNNAVQNADSPTATFMTDSSESLLSTVEVIVPQQVTEVSQHDSANVSDAQTKQETTSEDVKPDTVGESSKKEKDYESRFDKHPRFQELIKERNEYRNLLKELKAQLDALQKPQGQHQEGQNNAEQIDPKKLLELQTENPQAFLETITKSIREQVMQEIKAEQAKQYEEQKRMSAYDEYASKHPDIFEMWESGELQAFLEQNPHHNVISAHMYLTQEKREAELRAKIEKELEEKYAKRYMARENARVLSNTPTTPPTSISTVDPALADTKKFGGLAAVLAQKLEAMRNRR